VLQKNKIENSNHSRVENYKDSQGGISFESINDLSNWLDQQLKELETKHRDFTTMSSVRALLKR